jgi:hypothetical protein
MLSVILTIILDLLRFLWSFPGKNTNIVALYDNIILLIDWSILFHLSSPRGVRTVGTIEYAAFHDSRVASLSFGG